MLDHRIYTFLTVYETKNYTQAAKQLHITQPAVSMHIRSLQEEYNTKFFIQKGKQIKITESGRQFYFVASRIKNDVQHLQHQLDQAKTQKHLRLGTTLSVIESISDKLPVLYKENEQLYLHINVENTQTLLKQIDTGQIDMAIIEGNFDQDHYDSMIYQVHDFICVANKNHLFKKQINTIEDIRHEPLLIREKGSGTRDIMETIFHEKNLKLENFTIKGEIANLKALKTCLLQDIGISFFYRPVIEDELKKGTLIEVPFAEKYQHAFYILFLKNSYYKDTYIHLAKQLSKPYR